MKKAIRAAIASMLVLAFAVVGLSAITAGAASSPRIAIRGENYALTGTAETNIPTNVGDTHLWYWDSCDSKYRDALANVNDSVITHSSGGDYSGENRFQLNMSVSETKTAMGGVDPHIQIVWNSAVASVNNVYIAHHESAYTLTQVKIQYTTDKAVWNDVANQTYNTSGLSHEGDLDVEFDAVTNVLGIRVVMLGGSNPNLSEIEVFNQSKEITSIIEEKDNSLINNIAAGVNVEVSSTKDSNVGSNAVDRNLDTYWETAEGKTVGEYIVLNLGEVKDIAKLRIIWGGGKAATDGYTISVSETGEEGSFTAKTFAKPEHKETSSSRYENIIVFDDGVISAQYIKLEITKHQNGTTAQMWEFEAYGPVTTASDTMQLSTSADASVERDIFVATNVNRKEMPKDCFILATWTITKNDGTAATGESKIFSAYQTITLGNEVVDASDIEGANATDHVTGVLFKNVPANATVSVVFTVVDDILD